MGSGKGQAKRIKTNDKGISKSWIDENNIKIECGDRSFNIFSVNIEGEKRDCAVRRLFFDGEFEIRDARIMKIALKDESINKHWKDMTSSAEYSNPQSNILSPKQITDYYQYRINRNKWIANCNNGSIGCNNENASLVKFYLGSVIKTQDLTINDMSYIYTQLMYDMFNNDGISFEAANFRESALGLSFDLKKFNIDNYRIEIIPDIIRGRYHEKTNNLSLRKFNYAFLINQEKDDEILASRIFSYHNMIKGGSKIRGNLHSRSSDPLTFINSLWQELVFSSKSRWREKQKVSPLNFS